MNSYSKNFAQNSYRCRVEARNELALASQFQSEPIKNRFSQRNPKLSQSPMRSRRHDERNDRQNKIITSESLTRCPFEMAQTIIVKSQIEQ